MTLRFSAGASPMVSSFLHGIVEKRGVRSRIGAREVLE